MIQTIMSRARMGVISCVCICSFALTTIVQPVAAQTSPGVQDIANRLGSTASGETGAWLRRHVAGITADPALNELAAWALENYAAELSPYEKAILELLPFLAANADLLTLPDPATSDPARWEQFKSTLLGNPAVRAMLADGERVLEDPAALQQRLGELAAGLGSMTSEIPPTPAESCGNAQPSSLVRGVSVAANDGANSQVSGAVQDEISKPEFADFVRMSGPALAAAIDPQTDLPLVDANGNPIPVFNLGKFIKGVVKVAVAVTAVAVSVASGGSGAVIGAAIIAGLIAAESGVQDIVASTMEAAGCAPDAITCSQQRLCQVGMCSSGCCVNVGATSGALVRARILSCATNGDCERGDYCNEGCCTLILPD